MHKHCIVIEKTGGESYPFLFIKMLDFCFRECRNRVHTVVGMNTPEICPVCAHPNNYFEVHAKLLKISHKLKIKKEIYTMKYVCDVCGWEYDEEEGYPEGGIAPGTKWEDVPEDFECPLCFVGKDQFSKVE